LVALTQKLDVAGEREVTAAGDAARRNDGPVGTRLGISSA